PDVSSGRLAVRKSLLEKIQGKRPGPGSEVIRDHDARTSQAFDLLCTGKARAAFEMDREPERLRERYGMNRWGQSVLLAGRLIESGVSLVQVNWTRMEGDTTDSPAWDTHGRNAFRLKNHLMPKMDLAYSALLEDLSARGLLESTLVVWMGE